MSEPLAPSPGEIAGEAVPGGGISQEEASALTERMEAQATEIENLKKQTAGQSQSYNAEARAHAQTRYLQEQAELNAAAMSRTLEQTRVNQAAQPLAPPQLDFEAMQSDPDTLRRGMNDYGQYVAQSTLQNTHQMIQASRQETAQALSGLRGGSVAQALVMGEREWVDKGYDPDTFKSVKSDLKSHLMQSDDNLNTALNQEGAMSTLAFHLAGQQGLPIEAREAPEPPPSMDPGSPGSDGQPLKASPKELALWENVRRQLNLPADAVLTEEDLESSREVRARLESVSPGDI